MIRHLFCLLVLLTTSTSADLCTYCQCDDSSRSVQCTSTSLLIRTISLLPYVEKLILEDVRLPHVPHILFHSKLRVLRIKHCGLEDVTPYALLPLPGIEVLDLSDNHLEGLPTTIFRSLKKLRVVNLSGNRINDLSKISWILADNVFLERIDLSRNPLALSTSAVRFPPVHQLFLVDANLAKFDNSAIVFQESTACPFSEVCRSLLIDAQDWSHLNTLDMSSNTKLHVSSKALSIMENITYLNMANTVLPVGFQTWLEEKSRVRHLNISFSDLPLIDEEWTSCGEHLETLDVAGLKLKRLSLSTDCKVKEVHANENLIESTKINAVSLEVLGLKSNLLTDWPTPSPGTSLEHLMKLDLSNNLLTSMPADALTRYPSLQHLDLSHNQLEQVDKMAFPTVGLQLISLDISSNQLTLLPHPVLPSLLSLDASSNALVSIDPVLFAGLPQLQHLRLGNNAAIFSRCTDKCWSDHLDELTGLIELDLSNCALSRSIALSHLSSLRTLILRGNRILNVDATDLPSSVHTLDLGDNRIHFTSNISHLKSLKDLRMDNNPLRCDCSLFDMLDHLMNQSAIADSNQYFCYSGSWQYPLLPYLASVKPCNYYRNRNFVPILISIIAFALIVICCFLLSFMVYKKYSHRLCHLYKRLDLLDEEMPVRL